MCCYEEDDFTKVKVGSRPDGLLRTGEAMELFEIFEVEIGDWDKERS